tara:strand:+ start:896 stop:1063 length:168 start_codon:yes stop_codon:yes gene_type:complete
MSRSKEDREKALKWWDKLIIESRIEYHYKHYPEAKYEIGKAQIEIVWRRETQKKK